MQIQATERELSGPDYFVGKIDASGALEGVPVERKDIGDYISSKQSGHLDNQLYSLSYTFPFSYLVIIGSPSLAMLPKSDGTKSMSHKAFISSLVGSSLKRSPDGVGGVIVTVNLESDIDFVTFLTCLDEKIESGDFARVPKFIRHGKSPEDMLIFNLTSLPHVGKITAERLLEHFGTLRDVYTASEESLLETPGIGKKTAYELVTLFNLRYNPSNKDENESNG
jgi:ERCC4-type nuclease